MEIDSFFTIALLAKRYNVQPITLRRWVAAGLFPAPLRLGPRRCLWRTADVLAHERRAAKAAQTRAREKAPA